MSKDTASTTLELEERLRFETLIANLSSKFVNLPAGEIDREIMDAERCVCEVLDLDISAVWQWSPGPPGCFTLTHYYSAQDGPQPSMRLSETDFPWFRQLMLEGRIVPISTLDKMPPEAALDRENCRRLGVKSNLCLPLAVGGEPPLGILGLNTTRAERDWPETLVTRLEVVAQIFANSLARKRSDQALRESEERLTLAIDSAEAGLWVLDLGTHEFWASAKARAMFGYSPDEIINLERFRASVHPDDWAPVQQSLDRSAQEGQPVDVEYRIRPGEDRERWIVSRGRPLFKSTGEPERLIGLSMDITERKRGEERVRQLSLAVEQSPVSVVITDLHGNMLYVNRKFSEISGYPPAECLGRNPRILKSGETPPEAYKALWACITQGDTWRGEFRNLRKDGKSYWELAVISPLRDATGKITHFVGVKEDITDRRRAEESLRASEARLTAGTDLAGLGYYEVDYGERSCFLDDRFREICGVLPEIHQGLEPVQFWIEHLHPEDRQKVLRQRDQMHEGKIKEISAEYRYQHPTQGQKWIQHLARLARRGTIGQGARTFGVVRDITVAKRSESELVQQRVELAHLSRVAMLGELSGSLAHELNQPLTAILSNAQAAQRFLTSDHADLNEVRDILSDIVAEDKRAGEVIRRLRLLLKKGELQHHPLNLNETVLEVLKLVRSDLANHDVTALTDLAPGLPVIHGDGVQLQQVLLNLVMNACEAMAGTDRDSRELTIRTDRSEDGSVRVSVADYGPGIAPENLEKIFDSFYTTKAQGMGLGLAVCRTIITAHSGNLWATSEPGRGATLHFTLPVTGLREQGSGFRVQGSGGLEEGPGAGSAVGVQDSGGNR